MSKTGAAVVVGGSACACACACMCGVWARRARDPVGPAAEGDEEDVPCVPRVVVGHEVLCDADRRRRRRRRRQRRFTEHSHDCGARARARGVPSFARFPRAGPHVSDSRRVGGDMM